MDSPEVFLLYANDGSQIADLVKKRLEQNDTTVHAVNILHIQDPHHCSAAILFLTPRMFSVLKSSRLPDLKWLPQMSKVCALFFHETINFTGVAVQETLHQKLPSFRRWSVLPLGKKVRTLTLQILDLLEIVNEVADPELSLVSECDCYPEFEWKENQTVFISFKSQYSDEEKVTVEVNQKLFEATWINPYTCTFYFTDCNGGGPQLVTVCLDGETVGTSQIFIKDRDLMLLDDINDVASPLHYLQGIMKRIKNNESALMSESITSNVLDGTRKLLQRLNKGDSKDLETPDVQERSFLEEENIQRKSHSLMRQRKCNTAIRRKRQTMDEGVFSPSKSLEYRKSVRISKALENLCKEEEIPSITLNSELARSLPSDFFDMVTMDPGS
uniref:Uncharacterized protein LOC111118752 n=1 Tax=Crassostrea virginica TaxID=6565 RepID=A0A8B8CHV5_CRAVI|nr:uncharacterized protein LOC111118752 [Crassostrea virginica]